MSDITRVDDQCGLHGHSVHDIDSLRQGAGDVRIRFLVESYMGIADLHEQRLARSLTLFTLIVATSHGQIDRREHAALQGEKRSGPAIGHAFQGVATRLQQFIVRHVRLLKWGSAEKTSNRCVSFPIFCRIAIADYRRRSVKRHVRQHTGHFRHFSRALTRSADRRHRPAFIRPAVAFGVP
jgi:hypothetical protein